MRLYCFPHAGATSAVFRSWQAKAAPGLSIVGVDQPGRGLRAGEPKIADYRELVASMADYVLTALRAAPGEGYMTFGHSFGATMSLAVADVVARISGEPPRQAVLSAALPPALTPSHDETETMSDAELLDKIAQDGGTAPQLLSSSAMAGYLVGLMREDYATRRQFHRDVGLRVDFPFTLLAAQDDPFVTVDQMWTWAEHTTADYAKVEIAGGHFAVVQDQSVVMAIVSAEMVR